MTEIKSAVEQQLEKILKGDIDKLLDTQPDTDGTEQDIQDVPELVPIVYEEKSSAVSVPSKDLEDDYKFARSNLYGLIGRTNAALDLALKICAASEHPRALEVVATLISTSSTVSKELIGLHEKIEKSNKPKGEEKPEGKYTQINNYYPPKESEEKSVNDILDGLGEESNIKSNGRKTKKNSST